MPPPHLGWDAVVNSIFGYYSWPLRNERQHRETAPTLHSVHCVRQRTRGAGAGDPCRGRRAMRYPCVYMRDAACHCSFCVVSYILLGIYFQMVKLEELSQNKGTCFGKILCCFNCCVIWFKNVFSCPLVIFLFFFPSNLCLARLTNQTKPIAHKHMGEIGSSGAWGDECPVPWLQGSTSQTCTSPHQPVFKGLWWWGLHNNPQLHAVLH